jgi:hypothetical protein
MADEKEDVASEEDNKAELYDEINSLYDNPPREEGEQDDSRSQ